MLTLEPRPEATGVEYVIAGQLLALIEHFFATYDTHIVGSL